MHSHVVGAPNVATLEVHTNYPGILSSPPRSTGSDVVIPGYWLSTLLAANGSLWPLTNKCVMRTFPPS